MVSLPRATPHWQRKGELETPLTPQESEVLKLLWKYSSERSPLAQVASELNNISIHTVRSHERSIRAKLGVSTRAGIIQVALLQGLVDIPM